MRVLLLLVFLALAVAFFAAVAYRLMTSSIAAKQRRLSELRRKPTPLERYEAGEIDVFEYERLLDEDVRKAEKRRAARRG